MDITREASGYLESHDHVDGVPALGVESDRLDDCIRYYHRRGFRGLFGHPEFGFRQDNLDFLKRTSNATWLWFWDVSLKQIDALYELKDLAYVGINPQRPGIDFSRFPRLNTAINHWLKQDTGIGESTISKYYLWHFSSPKLSGRAGAGGGCGGGGCVITPLARRMFNQWGASEARHDRNRSLLGDPDRGWCAVPVRKSGFDRTAAERRLGR